MRAFINGIVFTVALLAAAGVAAVLLGAVPSGADVKPPALEEWAAKKSLHATLAREMVSLSNPQQPTDENLLVGVRLYGQNCSVCHGASDAKPSKLAQGFYIEAPQLAKDGVEDDPETMTYWKLAHGIRFTAMPSFEKTIQSDDLWKIAMFVKRMDKLPPAVDAAWKKLPSATATSAP